MTNDELGKLLNEAYEKRMAFINANREKLIEAWIAETGLKPSESELHIQESSEGMTHTMRCWVERRKLR